MPLGIRGRCCPELRPEPAQSFDGTQDDRFRSCSVLGDQIIYRSGFLRSHGVVCSLGEAENAQILQSAVLSQDSLCQDRLKNSPDHKRGAQLLVREAGVTDKWTRVLR